MPFYHGMPIWQMDKSSFFVPGEVRHLYLISFSFYVSAYPFSHEKGHGHEPPFLLLPVPGIIHVAAGCPNTGFIIKVTVSHLFFPQSR